MGGGFLQKMKKAFGIKSKKKSARNESLESVNISTEGELQYSEDDVLNFAKYLGMDVERDRDLLWIAEEGLIAELPDGWGEYTDEKGRPYYYNHRTDKSQWEHPLDKEYRELYKRMKNDKSTKGSQNVRSSLEKSGSHEQASNLAGEDVSGDDEYRSRSESSNDMLASPSQANPLSLPEAKKRKKKRKKKVSKTRLEDGLAPLKRELPPAVSPPPVADKFGHAEIAPLKHPLPLPPSMKSTSQMTPRSTAHGNSEGNSKNMNRLDLRRSLLSDGDATIVPSGALSEPRRAGQAPLPPVHSSRESSMSARNKDVSPLIKRLGRSNHSPSLDALRREQVMEAAEHVSRHTPAPMSSLKLNKIDSTNNRILPLPPLKY
uniref:WW domain-containing protein n=1 Tax=Palpitomonas bilix TaxID=652834 RepID=A0A7S3D1Z0_9EUKA|mmetsp:Transcript_18902/g.48093  ORF Transcript_18902/g.48093 Transcript_18902/m.48093 type:complete len:375 (+) Transcript_18902:274-1398(+)|eukprot:CAMPEP_0113873212 /NCGR_PEP_ID=MMETSP0780_2-20120614/3644_1 /TAXON_ID=652834 /ORGANISM="Palpitomonas bilix" /LENGTH=374 /DNA_ID=CAMNT_0000858831 /DNA_START=152 /DNA_END=1276 /DNA_ORIENTATION=- /assembly_acc=CAM_ASM_000599